MCLMGFYFYSFSNRSHEKPLTTFEIPLSFKSSLQCSTQSDFQETYAQSSLGCMKWCVWLFGFQPLASQLMNRWPRDERLALTIQSMTICHFQLRKYIMRLWRTYHRDLSMHQYDTHELKNVQTWMVCTPIWNMVFKSLKMSKTRDDKFHVYRT